MEQPEVSSGLQSDPGGCAAVWMDYRLSSDHFSSPPGFLSSLKCFVFSFSLFLSEDFTPVQYKAPEAPKPLNLVPPYNGFGSEEDSLSSCQGLLPKPPQKDFYKFMEKDRLDEL